MGAFLSTLSCLGPALLGVAIAVTGPLSVSHAAAQTLQNNAQQQIQGAQADYAAAQFDISRDFLVEFADNLKTFADFGSLLYDFRNLKLPRDASAATRAFFARIKPMQELLARGGREVPKLHEMLDNIYELADAIRQDLSRPNTDPLIATLSSHTLEKLGGLGLTWVASDKALQNLQKLADAGKISQPFAKYVGKYSGFLSFGADDLVAGIARGVGNGNWQDPETVADLLDAFNRGMWAAVGFLVSDGDRDVANLFSSAADLVAKTVRDHTVDWFASAYMKYGGFDKAILDLYVSTQRARLAHKQAPMSFEEFVNPSAQILRAVDPKQRSAADARFGLRTPPSPDTAHVMVIPRPPSINGCRISDNVPCPPPSGYNGPPGPPRPPPNSNGAGGGDGGNGGSLTGFNDGPASPPPPGGVRPMAKPEGRASDLSGIRAKVLQQQGSGPS